MNEEDEEAIDAEEEEEPKTSDEAFEPSDQEDVDLWGGV